MLLTGVEVPPAGAELGRAPAPSRAPIAVARQWCRATLTLRQISALTEYPELIDHPASSAIFPADALRRARTIVAEIGSAGAYSHSMGVPAIRQRIADFITGAYSRAEGPLTGAERDGFPAHTSEIYITAGASSGVANLMQVLINSPLDGVLIPIPQYPLYTAALALNSARAVPYYLQEHDEWSLDTEGLREGVRKARAEGTILKAMVVINPGNPTGSILSLQNMEDIVHLCYEERLVLFADEVYQDNIYTKTPFTSFKKVINTMGEPYASSLELVSFHSISKGQTGECGRRGGYFELVNFSPEAEEQIYKLASIQLCPSLGGQIGVDILVCPPKEGEESYPLWTSERAEIASTLKMRSEVIATAFKKLEGVHCNSAHVRSPLIRFLVLTVDRARCISSRRSRFPPRPSRRPRRRRRNLTRSTRSVYSRRRESASCPARDSVKCPAPGISGRRSSRPK